MYFDTHAHYDDEQYDCDRDTLIALMHAAGVELIVDPASDIPSSEKSLSISEEYPFIYSAVGVHPHEAGSFGDEAEEALRRLCASEKAVAIGEIGLDYHYDFSPRDVQRACFRRQMEIARELDMPVVIHEREASSDCLEIVTDFPDVRGVYHCYSGSWETAKTILSQGWYLSFNGVITFKNARRSLEVVEKMPADRLMMETDSPYLAPVPVRGTRNSSLNLPYIAEKIAGIRGITREEAAGLTLENGKRFFGLV